MQPCYTFGNLFTEETKTARFGFIFGAVITVLAGCSGVVKQSELSSSLETWNALKTQNGDSYHYETSFASWAGFGNKTTLTVQNGEVTARAYEAYRLEGEGQATITESYTEEGTTLGTHEAGAAPRTVDELYGVCRAEVLTQSALANDFYLTFRADGVLETCEYAPKNCADDCSRGVNVTELEFLPAAEAASNRR